jgi:hypothetical protein
MPWDEWNLEDALVVEREEGIEYGLEKGRTGKNSGSQET